MNGISNAIRAPFPWQQQGWQRLIGHYRGDKLAHAYLVAGPAGIGKLAFIRQFSKLLLCLEPDADIPCGHCHHCQLGSSNEHPDILLLEPEDGARDITVDQVRRLGEFVHHTGHSGLAKVVIVNHAHRMNRSAANALLKTLEEPSNKTYLFLVTDLPGYLPATIRSRCQRLTMSVPSLDMTSDWLQQHLGPDDDATALLAVAGCRPMVALEMASADELADRQQFLASLPTLLLGETDLQVPLKHGLKISAAVAIGYLLDFSTTLVHGLTQEEAAHIPDRESLQVLLSKLKSAGTADSLRKILQLYELGLVARKQLLGTANPNPQLLLETLLRQWSLLLIAADRPG
ncbi:MAG: DNA polymerase III subunit delta' [Pseudohongiellaceae bacterium]|jgi:DNA polymerase-3 subunit delta'